MAKNYGQRSRDVQAVFALEGNIQCSQTRGENDIEMGSILFEVGEIVLVFLE